MAKKEIKKEKIGQASTVILKPRITEKAAMISANNVYTFLVDPKSNKTEIALAFETLFGKKPLKVSVVKYSPRVEVRRGAYAKKKGYKKVYVYLKKGETIDFM
ncbi:50S ribosomal protein L23 [Candidatus Nomurabacteria bacterium]|nr:50S ribosomal protein L23 [Candidatus Nomurabacteria bacterium]MCB9820872.1 50S ribosomal protein L23 [Candidatus Nomurabacteria bacterium]